jgi:hypothetical protein
VTTRAGAGDTRWSTSACFIDFDRDGWLDLYIVNYVDHRIENHEICRSLAGRPDYCAPYVYPALPDRLLRNRGDGSFEDVTARSGIGAARGSGLGVVSLDINDDGWLDLFVANDGMANFLWVSQGDGTFRDEAMYAGVALNSVGEPEAGMGVAAGDLDGDGDEDIFVTHLVGETNTLYRNRGDGTFDDYTATSLGTESLGATGFGTAGLDVDNDGWMDLLVLNGAVKRIEQQALDGAVHPLAESDRLLRGQGHGRFSAAPASVETSLGRASVSRAAAIGDIDNDGDPDVLASSNAGPVRLLVNETNPKNCWLGLRLVDPVSGRDMLGALASVVHADQTRSTRRCRTGGSYCSASDPRLLFGLGSRKDVDRVHVRWPSGSWEVFDEVTAGRYNELVRGTGQPGAGPPT